MQDQHLGSRYLLASRLGSGGMGEVFLARTRDSTDPLAVKVLRPEFAEDQDMVSRFLQESRLLRGIRHPNVVRVLDLVAEADRFGIVMEYVPGGDLRHAVPLPCPSRTALELLAQVADGLAAIHAAGIIHRDLKPENVLVQILPGGAPRARVTDFGVAHYSDSVSTRHNRIVGSTGYLSPESAAGQRPGPEGDVYALGVMLYEMCEGRRPFAADNPWAVIRAHAESPIPRPARMPDAIWQLVSAMLAKDPAGRPSATAAAVRLRALAEAYPPIPYAPSSHVPAPPTPVPGATFTPARAPHGPIPPRPQPHGPVRPGLETPGLQPLSPQAPASAGGVGGIGVGGIGMSGIGMSGMGTGGVGRGGVEPSPPSPAGTGPAGPPGGVPTVPSSGEPASGWADPGPADPDPTSRRAVRRTRAPATRHPRSRRRVVTAAALSVPLVLLLVSGLMALSRSGRTPRGPATRAVGPSVTPTSVPATPATATATTSPSTSTSTRPARTTTTTRTSTPTTSTPAFPVPAVPTLAVDQPTPDSLEDSDRRAPLVIGSVDPTAGTLTSIMILYDGGAQSVPPVAGSTGPYYSTVTGLQNGRRYTFTARVCNSYGECASSPPVAFTPYTVPTLGSLSARVSSTAVAVTWSALQLNGNPRPWSCRLTADTIPHDTKAPTQQPVALRGGTVSWHPLAHSSYTATETCTDGARTVVSPTLSFATP